MGKTRRGAKEYSREQQLVNENKKLKRTISSLRKQLARIDLDRYSHVKDVIEEHYAQESREDEAVQILEKLKKKWKCFQCVEGILEIITYTRTDKTFYFRQCDCCEYRTAGKEYSPSVEGIIKKSK